MEIDWDYWLNQRLKIADWELLALSFNINPEEIKSYEIDDLNHIVDVILDPKFRKTYLKRKDTLQDYRFIAFDYFRNDGIPVDYYDASDSKLKMVYLKRVLLWLKNEEIRWDLPKELAAYIETLDKPNEPHWAQGLVDNLNNKLTQPKVTQKWQLKPGKVYPGYRLALFEFLEKEYKDGKEYPPNAYDFIAKLKQDVKANQAPEDIFVRNKGIDYITKDGVTNKADLKAINQAIDNLIIKLSEDE